MPDPSSNHFDVFLSYHWRDHVVVEALAHRLRDQDLRVFLDPWYLTPGQSWLEALEGTLARCGAVAVCLGPGDMGPWQQREQYLALQRQVTAEKQGQHFPVIYGLPPICKHEIVLMREGLRSYIRLRCGTSCVPSLDGCRAAAPQHSHGLLLQPMTETRVCSRGGDHSCPSACSLLLRNPW